MKKRKLLLIPCFFLALAGLACPSPSDTEKVLRQFPLEQGVETLTRTGVEFDPGVSADGGGSLKVTAGEPLVALLFQTGDIDLENARLIYRARVKTQDAEGQVYLEMYCHFAAKGSFFSRGLESQLTGTTDWTTLETPFFLKKGENPDNVTLNLVFTGKGTAWINDIRLLDAPLR